MDSPDPPLYRSSGRPGYSDAVSAAGHVVARKLAREVHVRFSAEDCTIGTNEGLVHARAGDAILTGIAGEHWRVSRLHFDAKYDPVAPTIAGEDGLYRSRCIRILARKMPAHFQVDLADGRSRLSGRPGDWLVDYGDGSLGIVSPGIFATTYELLT